MFLFGFLLLAIRWPLKSFIVGVVFIGFSVLAISLFQYFFLRDSNSFLLMYLTMHSKYLLITPKVKA
ncbi:hypothetical protein C4K02_1729 [Pseudomonas synxantha]|nr:hypothetical protein C4K02_1729 [Pseudomonas synxantha]